MNNHILVAQEAYSWKELAESSPVLGIKYYATLCGLSLPNKTLRKPRNGKICANCQKIMRKQK